MQKSLSLRCFEALLIEPYKDVFRTPSGHLCWWDTSLGVESKTAWGRLHNACRRCPQDIGRGRPMGLHIGQYLDVLITLQVM